MGGLIPAGTTWDDDPREACTLSQRLACKAVLHGKTYLETKHQLGPDEGPQQRLHFVACTGEILREKGRSAYDIDMMVRLLEYGGDEARGARRWIHRLIWGEG